MGRDVLERILAPITVAAFAERYFEKRPLRVPGRVGKFKFLFGPAEFNIGLDRATDIRAVFREGWQAHISPADIEEMIQAGATICIGGMEKAHPKLEHAASQIKRRLNYCGSVDFRAYLSSPGHGFDIHFDARVVTTLQIEGTKRWWYSAEPAVSFPSSNSGRPPSALSGEQRPPRLSALRSILLRPGDLLCLPAGTWHRARARTKSLALNLAFDHSGAGVLDAIMTATRRRLEKEAAWRQPLPVSTGKDSKRLPDPVARTLRARIDDLQAELSRLRASEAALRRAWRMLVEPQRRHHRKAAHPARGSLRKLMRHDLDRLKIPASDPTVRKES